MFNNKHPSTNTITQTAWGKDKIRAKYRQVEKYYQIVGEFANVLLMADLGIIFKAYI